VTRRFLTGSSLDWTDYLWLGIVEKVHSRNTNSEWGELMSKIKIKRVIRCRCVGAGYALAPLQYLLLAE
jgi:hypothetical protein